MAEATTAVATAAIDESNPETSNPKRPRHHPPEGEHDELEDTKEKEEEEGGVESTADDEDHTNPLWKTTLCSYFRRHSGSCSHGDTCRYAHSEDELRPRPDNTWDPTSQRAKKLPKTGDGDGKRDNGSDDDFREEVVESLDSTTLEKCIVGLPMKWDTDKLNSFLNQQGILYKTAKKKKKMTVGFITFTDFKQLHTAVEEFKGKSIGGKDIKLADAIHRSNAKRPIDHHHGKENYTPSVSSFSENDDITDTNGINADQMALKTKNVRDVVTPLAHMTYCEQLEYKKASLLKNLKRLTRNARKACPSSLPFPDWILKSREIGGLPCEFEGIIQSPLINGYRNKCEFSVGYSLTNKKTVGFMLGNFREGVTAVHEPVNCPNVSLISCHYALLFQDFLQSSILPVWNRIDNTGFWRQLTVREGRGRDAGESPGTQIEETQITEVMLIVQVCSLGVDEELLNDEFKRMTQHFAQGASTFSSPLPLSAIVVQDHKGISNAAPADCPLIPLPIPSGSEDQVVTEARIHDHMCNLRFCISPTAFFQVNTLAAEKLYSLAGDWASLDQDTLLFDICCGTGTIGLTLAHRVGMVVGIEMNSSAVSDAIRNAAINNIKNCKFICSKAEDVIGKLLKEYINNSQDYERSSSSLVSCTTNTTSNEIQIDEIHENREVSTMSGAEIHDNYQESTENNRKANQNASFSEQEAFHPSLLQFKNVVAIVDPPRVGLHPVVIKALRTNQGLRRLIYISCNPESLLANAIELCTPTADEPQKAKNNWGWRNMGCAGLARQRAKSMPKSEPFQPIRTVAVDLFPHTPHCEMVMLFER